MSKVDKELQQAFLHELPDMEIFGLRSGLIKPYAISGWYPGESAIPSFTHTYLKEHGKSTYACIDIRPFVKRAILPILDVEKLISNKTEFKYAMYKLITTMDWVESTESIISLNNFDQHVYAQWISGALSYAYNLDAEERMKLRIAAYLYYRSLFVENVDDDYHQAGVIQISNKLPISATDAIKYADGLTRNTKHLEDFILNITKCSSKMKNITSDLLVSLIARGWFGFNQVENIAAALMHPPTFISLLRIAMEVPIYKRTTIMNAVNSLRMKQLEKEWIKSFEQLISDYRI